jgi:two-component system OmpR family sensor kinase
LSLRARIIAAIGLVLLVGGLAATFLPLSARSSQENETTEQLESYVKAAEGVASASAATVPTASPLSSAYVAELTPGGSRQILARSVVAPDASPKTPSAMSTDSANLSIQLVGSIDGTRSWNAVIVQTPAGSRLLIAVPRQGKDQTIGTVLLIARLLVLFVIVVAAWWILRLSLHPIAQVTRVAKAITSGDRSQRVAEGVPGTEAANLARSFNSMLDQQHSSEDRLRQFVADASHELRTPVAAIGGFADLYRHGAISPADLDDVMRRIGQESARMRGLVEDLLLLARLDEGRPTESELLDVTCLATDAALDASASFPSRTVSVDGEPGVMVMGDEARIRQVLANLVTNSLNYTGGTVEIQVRSGEELATISVRDHGPGLEPEALRRAFDRFWRSPEVRSQPGTGLGLPIVRGIVAAHDGTVEMESSPAGTCVRVLLPIAGAYGAKTDELGLRDHETQKGKGASCH